MATHPDPTMTRNIRDRYSAEMLRRFELAIRKVTALVRSFSVIHAQDEPAAPTGPSISMVELQVQIQSIIQTTLSGDIASFIEDMTKITVDRSSRAATRRFAAASGIPIAEANEILILFPQAISDEVQANLVLAQVGLITRLEDTMTAKIMASLAKGIEQGETIGQLAARIQASTGMERARAVTIARTETIRTFNQAAVARYTQHGVSMVEWITAGDTRVDKKICRQLEGMRFLIGHEPPNPAHPRCRCSWIPVIVGGPRGAKVSEANHTPEILGILASLGETWDSELDQVIAGIAAEA